MNSEIANNLILNFDIFKAPSNLRDVHIPDYAQNFIVKLQTSIARIQDEVLEKHIVLNDAVPKVVNELERSLNGIMKKNLLQVKSIDSAKKIKLGDLYNYSVRNNASLKRHLNSVYLTSRVYKTLFRDHPLMDNLKLRLISVRCKAIRDICLTESRRGKIRHLRCWRGTARSVSAMPKRLRSIVKKMARELHKCDGRDSAEIDAIVGNNTWETTADLLDDAVGHYYKSLEPDSCRSDEYARALAEMARANNKLDDAAVLNYCDQETAMELLAMNCDEIQTDFAVADGSEAAGRRSAAVDRRFTDSVAADVSAAAVPVSHDEADKEDLDILDFENFQLVDVWEEKSEEGRGAGEAGDSANAVATANNAADSAASVDNERPRDARATRKKRRSRFAPLTEADLILLQQQQPRALGFCSTFVDEDASAAAAAAVVAVSAPPIPAPVCPVVVEKASISSRMFDVVAMPAESIVDDELPQKASDESAVTEEVAVTDKGELCKLMLRKFHESLQQALVCRREGKPVELASWGGGNSGGTAAASVSAAARDASNVILADVEAKMAVLMRDHLNRHNGGSGNSVRSSAAAKRRLARALAEPVADRPQQPLSPSPTPFDQTIEASLKKPRTASHSALPLAPQSAVSSVVRRASQQGGAASPERARLRAMMLSYKRDVEKSRCGGDGGSDKRSSAEEGGPTDECGMTELLLKAQLADDDEHDMDHMDHHQQKDDDAPLQDDGQREMAHPLDSTVAGDSADCGSASADNTGVAQATMPSVSQLLPVKREKLVAKQEAVAAADTDSEGLVTSSDEDNDDGVPKLTQIIVPQQQRKPTTVSTTAAKECRVEISRMQWLVPPPETVSLAPIPAPATPFLDDEPQSWTGRKVFVVDSHDKGSSTAHLVKTFLHKNGARVYDTSNYKQAGKDLHVLVHHDWRFPDSRIDGSAGGTVCTGGGSTGASGGPSSGANSNATNSSSPISLLLLKNNSGVHFLSYTDLESVSRFACQTVFPHSRSCLFLDRHALLATHADNIRNMLEFMITERQTSNRIWCLKISRPVHALFRAAIDNTDTNDADMANLKEIESILTEYSTKDFGKADSSMSLVEIQTDGEDSAGQQDHVLSQQYYLQKKFRHFCILTDNLNTTELDIGYLSIYGVAVLPLNTFLTNKTGKYIRKSAPL